MNIKAIVIGAKNYNNDTDIPQNRLDALSKCKFAVDAPIKTLRLKDRYKETNNKICKKCYCPLATKARQDLDKCDCWI